MSKKRRSSLKAELFVTILFFAGLAVFAYPFVARAVNTLTLSARVTRDRKKAEANVKRQQAKIKRENEALAEQGLRPNADVFTQKGQGVQQIKALREHLVGAVTIPSLAVNLPLYDTTNEVLMESGAVVLPGTSFPSGGASTHTVVTAHSGIPSKTLFDDLHELKKGQLFIFTVDGEHLAYKVNRIKVIEPDDVSSLQIEPGKDLATLMTCTPIGQNSHRLLVTGYRVPYTEQAAKASARSTTRAKALSWAVIAAVVLGLALLGFLIYRLVRKHRRR